MCNHILIALSSLYSIFTYGTLIHIFHVNSIFSLQNIISHSTYFQVCDYSYWCLKIWNLRNVVFLISIVIRHIFTAARQNFLVARFLYLPQQKGWKRLRAEKPCIFSNCGNIKSGVMNRPQGDCHAAHLLIFLPFVNILQKQYGPTPKLWFTIQE